MLSVLTAIRLVPGKEICLRSMEIPSTNRRPHRPGLPEEQTQFALPGSLWEQFNSHVTLRC